MDEWRRLLEDVLDAMGDAEVIVLPDGTEVYRADIWQALSAMM